jgi:hypothetical protein
LAAASSSERSIREIEEESRDDPASSEQQDPRISPDERRRKHRQEYRDLERAFARELEARECECQRHAHEQRDRRAQDADRETVRERAAEIAGPEEGLEVFEADRVAALADETLADKLAER